MDGSLKKLNAEIQGRRLAYAALQGLIASGALEAFPDCGDDSLTIGDLMDVEKQVVRLIHIHAADDDWDVRHYTAQWAWTFFRQFQRGEFI